MRVLNIMPINYKCTSLNKNNYVSPNYKKNVSDSVSFGLKLPDNFGTVIENKLFRGGFLETAEHFQALKEKGVTFILDLCGDGGGANPKEAAMARQFNMEYRYKNGHEFSSDMINENGELSKTAELIKERIDANAVVYIHCDEGKNRTGLAVAYYQLKFLENMKLQEVKEHYKKHQGCDLNILDSLAAIFSF